MRSMAQGVGAGARQTPAQTTGTASNARLNGLRRSLVGDRFEREADHTASAVMGSSAPRPQCQQRQGTPRSPGLAHRARRPGAPPGVLPSSGRALEPQTRAFFEPRFGHDFSEVRVHTDAAAGRTADALQADAYTLGDHIVFAPGQYRPTQGQGGRLLAHELTHVLQQRGAQGVEHTPSRSTLMGRWKIEDPSTVQVAGGQSNEQILADGFRKICDLAGVVTRGTARVVEVTGGPPAANRTEGCDCLRIIQDDHDNLLAGRPSFLQAMPSIGVVLNGWSGTLPSASNPRVGVRHPEGPFEWGYWSGGDQRVQKSFFRTLAHEVCGHMAAAVQRVPSGRGSARGHNEAILRENKIAAEHGVPAAELRGLDRDEGGVTAGAHRGESFLRAQVFFDHNANTPNDPAVLTRVVDGVVQTLQSFAAASGTDRIRVQLESFWLRNETGTLATRVNHVRDAIARAFAAQGIADPFPDPDQPGQTISRFATPIIHALAEEGDPTRPHPKRRVDIYLFHRSHSAR